MSSESPLEITYVKPKLLLEFTDKISPGTGKDAEDKERNFLSRALAAYALQKWSGCTIEAAADGVVDGGGDWSIDAVLYVAASSTLWLVQSKYVANGKNEPEIGEIGKFVQGVESLLAGTFEPFRKNQKWRSKIPLVEAALRNKALNVRAVVVYSGIATVSEDRMHLIEPVIRRYSLDSEYLQFHFCNLTTITDWITGADDSPGVKEVELTVYKPGWITTPYETVYGVVPMRELAKLYNDHGKQLIAANIRAYKGRTEVNQQIVSTVREEPEHFLYLNNGLTAYCNRLHVHNADRGNAESKRVTAQGFSVVNGAQTLGSIAKALRDLAADAPDGHVFIKIISLHRCDNERDFAERITRSTNFQNQIGLRDFIALNEQQERIANGLSPASIYYHYKTGDDTPKPDAENFSLEEATTACACLAGGKDKDIYVRVLSNRESLYSLDKLSDQDERTRYSIVFREDRSARTVWRSVQMQRHTLAALRTFLQESTGVRKAFFENARWLLLNVLFVQLRYETGNELALSAEEIEQITVAAQEYAEHLWTICEAKGFVTRQEGTGNYESPTHLKSVFCNVTDCTMLRGALLARLNARAATFAAPAVVTTP